jgi:hypothetical protein
VALFSGFSKLANTPLGNFANAALVGANTVMFFVLLKAGARPAAFTAVTSVLNWGADIATFATFSAAFAEGAQSDRTLNAAVPTNNVLVFNFISCVLTNIFVPAAAQPQEQSSHDLVCYNASNYNGVPQLAKKGKNWTFLRTMLLKLSSYWIYNRRKAAL